MDHQPTPSPSNLLSELVPVATSKSSFYSLRRFCLLLLTFASLLPSVFAQSVAPTNSFTPDPINTGIEISFGSYSNRYFLQPLVSAAYLADNQSLQGSLYHTGAYNTTSLNSSSIAFITCDYSAYVGFLNAVNTIANAISRAPVAVVLYSDIAAGCSFSPGSAISETYNYIYSMTRSAGNGTMFSYAASSGGHVVIQKRSLFDSNSTTTPNVGNTNGPTGPSPSTAVAMIILYSITVVIIALFLIIIVTGAVRAHRHPERYGPRNAHGRPRQSRARGLARAMLETLPIVKFGENEEDKAPDVEMTAANVAAKATTTSESGGVISGDDKDAPPTEGESQAVAGAEKGEQSTSQEPEGPPSTPPEQNENQGCSICTDDFEIGQDVRVLPCSHSFHPACIDPWLLNVSGTCPLCRIDLRPKAAQTQDGVNSTERPERPERSERGERGEREDEIFPPPLDPGADTSRRASRRHSLIWDLLNPSRMRDATPQERIAALRRVREERQLTANEESEARRRRRLTARLHDVFSIRTTPRNQEANDMAPVAEEQNGTTGESSNPVN